MKVSDLFSKTEKNTVLNQWAKNCFESVSKKKKLL